MGRRRNLLVGYLDLFKPLFLTGLVLSCEIWCSFCGDDEAGLFWSEYLSTRSCMLVFRRV